MGLNQTIKNSRRVLEIAQILMKYGFEEVITNTPLKGLVPNWRREKWVRDNRPVFEYTLWERVRMATEELGPTFIKGAQVLSNRPDLLPDDLIAEFQRLQSNVKPFAYEQVKEIFREETGKTIEDTFASFSETPLAAASIGQVHRARLHDGQDVVVKVQRPGLKRIVNTDLSILKEIARRGEAYFESQGVSNLLEFVEAFEKTMLKELSYTNEARNIRQFREFYKSYTNFYIPNVHDDYTTERVMVLEMIKGCKITDVKQLRAWDIDPEKIAEAGMDIYMTQMFEYGYFHADPHPGNVLVRPDGVICLLDFGMVGRLSNADKFNFAGIMVSMARKDARSMGIYLRKLAISDRITDTKEFENDLQNIIDDFASLDIKESSIADLGTELQRIVYQHKLKVSGTLFLLLRSLAILEGIGKLIHPNFNTFEYVRPYGMKLLRNRFSKENILNELVDRFNHIDYYLRYFPGDLQEIVRSIRQGRLHLEITHKGYEKVLESFQWAANRLSLAIVIAGLLIASAVFSLSPMAAQSAINVSVWLLVGAFVVFLLFVITSFRKP
jgi:ubiquinone biosynthesis protein